MATEPLPPLPTHVVTGFLGAGKTTLVNHWLANPRGERLGVIVNEFGDLGLDGDLIVAADEEVIELANGCVCCTVRSDLVTALHGLLDRRRRRLFALPLDRLVIETSGLASPGPILQTIALEERLANELVPGGVVTVVHAAHVEAQLAEHGEAREQLGYADAVLVSHVDEVTPAALDRVLERLAREPGLAEVVIGRRGQTDVDLRALEPEDLGWERAERAAAVEHSEGASAVALEADVPLDLHRLKMWLQLLERDPTSTIWRVKGLLACVQVPEPVVIQGVYQTLEIGPGQGSPPERSRLVILGRDLEKSALERGWEHCLSRS